ncbi:MAG: PolC-type DNA polymerase III, partial [Oscillospiraceae bacterium]|nr:PolC-type DNA polymerase III [Oscillospiraceae bacterium]
MGKNVSLLNMFTAYHPPEEIAELLEDTVVTDADLDVAHRRATVHLTCDHCISVQQLEEIESSIAQLYDIRKLIIVPVYPAERLTDYDFKELQNELICNYSPAIAILAGCRWEVDEKSIKLHLRANGVDEITPYLRRAEDLLFARFGVRKKIDVVPGSTAEGDELADELRRLRQDAIRELPAVNFEGKEAPKPADAPIFGKKFSGKPSPMNEIDEDAAKTIVEGEVFAVDHREMKKGNAYVISFDVTDYTGSVRVNQYMPADRAKPILSGIKIGMWVRILGQMAYDSFADDMVLRPTAIIKADRPQRSDNAEGRRVELHLHTNMSAMDALTDTKSVVKQAAKWGHPAIAITDHGVAQSFPDAMHAAEGAIVAGTDQPIKILYGCEAYYYDDSKDVPLDSEIVAFDLETTGLSPDKETIIEIGAAIFKNGKVLAEYSQLIDPQRPLDPKIVELTGIRDDMLRGKPTIDQVLPEFLAFCGDRPLAAHNASFDVGFLKAECDRLGIRCEPVFLDSLDLAKMLLPHLHQYKLNIVADELKLPEFHHHRALDDAKTVGYMLEKFAGLLRANGSEQFPLGTERRRDGKRGASKTYHMILLAKNQIGLRNLYRLISYAHLKHFYRVPRIPRSELIRYREGLIVGSACEAGELFTAVTAGASEEALRHIASFYDYLEIQPISNNRFMIEEGIAASDDDLRTFNRTVVKLGEALGKPVVATCDVHFQEPQDEIYRNILLATKGMGGDRPLPLYFRTTEEMLEEFSYLGEEKAREVVITNTQLIADMCETLRPVPRKLFAPKIENSAVDLQRLVYGKLHELYGDEPPELIQRRVDTEMHDIISCHYDVIYMSAQKLVKNSMDNGYIVGSRGSVGSSIVAYLAGITEVNSFPPHYRCPKCKHTTFDVPEGCACGPDLPDAVCPVCGTAYAKEGFNIPFETFLGFGGDKVPDIDLNFSGEYQAQAHAYCVQMFGKEYVFRAGTISKVADKTAYGYVKKYMEEHG